MKSTMDCITINYVLYQKESQIIESSLRTRMRCETIHGHLTSDFIDWNNACSESSVTGQRYDVYLNSQEEYSNIELGADQSMALRLGARLALTVVDSWAARAVF